MALKEKGIELVIKSVYMFVFSCSTYVYSLHIGGSTPYKFGIEVSCD